MKKVLILGGSGFVGRHTCEQLVRAGWHITVPTRRLSQAASVQHLPGLTVLQANILEEADLRSLLPGHDAVINLVAVLHGDAARFERIHVELPAKLARACQALGIQRLLHVSALGADPLQVERAPSLYLRSKSRGEAVLRAAEGLALTVLRPSVIFGADDRFLNLFARLQSLFPLLPLAGAHSRFQPVWVEDVAQAITRCLGDVATIGQTYELCGPQMLTLAELVALAGEASGHPRPIIPLPAPLARLQAWLMELAPGEPLMSRDNLDSMRIDNVAGGQLPGLAALGIKPAAVAGISRAYLGQQDPWVGVRAR